jgi:hypothetical protein
MGSQRPRYFVITKRIAVKRYVVKLSGAERERLNTLIHAGKESMRMSGVSGASRPDVR